MKSARLFLVAIFIVGCAGYRPIIDTGRSGFDHTKYEADLRDCQAFARQVNPAGEAVGGAAIGAGIGAVGGLLVGALFDLPKGPAAGIGAALGGFKGTVTGAAGGIRGQKDVINNCLRGRGYSVLR